MALDSREVDILIVESQRVADLINKNQMDSAVWLMRHAIDDALKLIDQDATMSELKNLLEWAQGSAGDFIEKHASARISSSGPR